MLIYVAPDPGIEWTQGPSVFHPDEPLGGLRCALSGALDTATLERRAREVGITTFEWWVTEGDPGRRESNVERTSKRPEGEVEHAQRIGPAPCGWLSAPPTWCSGTVTPARPR